MRYIVSFILVLSPSWFFLFSQNSPSLDNQQHVRTDSVMINNLIDEVKQLSSKANYKDAIIKAKESLSLSASYYGNGHLTTIGIYFMIGSILDEMASYEESLVYYYKALEGYESIYGSINEKVADCYNNIGLVNNAMGEYSKSIDNIKKGLDLRVMIFGRDHARVADSYTTLGIPYKSLGDYDTALFCYNEALKIRQKSQKDERLSIGILQNNLGNVYRIKGDYDKAISSYQQSAEKLSAVLGDFHPNVAFPYNNIGIVYDIKGAYHKAMEYHRKALSIRLKALGENHPSVAASYHNLGAAASTLGEINIALEYYKKSAAILYGKFGDKNVTIANTYENLSQIYQLLGLRDSALLYLDRALSIRLGTFGENHPDIANAYYNYGGFYLKEDSLSTSAIYLDKALGLYKSIFGEKHPAVSKCYIKQSELEIKRGNFLKAEELLKETERSLNYVYLGDYRQVTDIFLLLEYLGLKRNVIKRSRFFHKDLIDNYNMHFQIVDYLSTGNLYNSNVDKLLQVYHQAIADYMNINEDQVRSMSFHLSELNKSRILYKSIRETEALHFSGIPQELLQEEYNYRMDIAFYDKKRQEKLSSGLNETDTVVLAISNVLFNLTNRYDSLKQRMELSYPDYYRAKYDLSTLTVEQVQRNLLQPGQSLVEYVVGDSSLFIFLIQPDYYEVQEVKIDSGFQQLIQKMTREGIYGYYGAPKAKRSPRLKARANRNYAEAAAELYNLLIAPVKDKLTTQVIIIPDGALGYVPFEALLSEKPAAEADFSNYPFFVKTHQLSYSYSATLLNTMRNKQHRQEPGGKLLALAPFFGGDADTLVVRLDSLDYSADLALKDSLSLLPASGLEVKTIANLLKGDSYYGDAASIGKFQELAPQYRILHLSTHAKADDRVGDYAYLAFGLPDTQGEFAKLYARDLYNLSINADMVVLSACETGTGKLQRGEGIVSLARAFAYAGAKSIMTTLWKVEEQATKDLAIAFYKYLKKRKTKDEALRLAKMEYLKKNKNNGELLHPFFWAGMIGIGDMGAVR